MKPILYAPEEKEYKTNGLGRLSDAISCTVTEERNGQYELHMVYPQNGIHFADIKNGCQIYCVPVSLFPARLRSTRSISATRCAISPSCLFTTWTPTWMRSWLRSGRIRRRTTLSR